MKTETYTIHNNNITPLTRNGSITDKKTHTIWQANELTQLVVNDNQDEDLIAQATIQGHGKREMQRHPLSYAQMINR
jgi:hypothetical protein